VVAESCNATVDVEGNAVKMTCIAAAIVGDEEGWVQVGGAAALVASHRLFFERKVSNVLSPSNVRLEGEVSGASTCREPFICIRCCHHDYRERFCRARFPDALDDEVVTCVRSPVVAPCQQGHYSYLIVAKLG
jgi:hypothetical protein